LLVAGIYLAGSAVEAIGWAKLFLARARIHVNADLFPADTAANVAANELAAMNARLRFLNEQVLDAILIVAGLLILILAAVVHLRASPRRAA